MSESRCPHCGSELPEMPETPDAALSLIEVPELKALSPLSVYVDFTRLRDRAGQTEAFRLIGLLKEMLG